MQPNMCYGLIRKIQPITLSFVPTEKPGQQPPHRVAQTVRYKLFMKKNGFTLIELLVVISIIAVLAGLSLFALQGARESARDARRKADLEQIRSAIELYKADCGDYPASLPAVGSSLVGDGSPSACSASNTYIAAVPGDIIPGRAYLYSRTAATTYELCASLEGGSGSVACGGSSSCDTATCNYKVINP